MLTLFFLSFLREIESCNHLIASLCKCLSHLQTIHDWSENGSLFPTENYTTQELFNNAETINQYCFYGRALGFQFYESMRPVLKFISICMAGFSEAYYSNGGKIIKATSSMWTSGKYFMDPELRARRIVNISQNSSVDFCKAFWFLAESELMHALPNFMGSQLKVNKIITITPEPLKLENVKTGELVDIPIPKSHLGEGPIMARLLSATRREGMIGEQNMTKKKSMNTVTDKFLFHCHGGGFVAQSSKSHEVYLKEWAIKLNIPILSIDYSLAPEAPFPRAHEEVFYAYCWSLENAKLLGTTAEKIILAGDSAGANLCLGLTIKAIEMGIRKPDGIFAAYMPTVVSFTPSPARLLCLMDPLLPFGFLLRCLKAYAFPSNQTLGKGKEKLIKLSDLKKAASMSHSNSRASKSSLSAVCEDREDGIVEGSKTEKENQRIVEKAILQSDFIGDNNSDESDSFEENSVWEHILASDSDMQHLEAHKSPVSDATSDTLAGSSFRSAACAMEASTPEETNGISLEEEISIPTDDEIYGPLTVAEVLELNPPDEDTSINESKQYVNEFIERLVIF